MAGMPSQDPPKLFLIQLSNTSHVCIYFHKCLGHKIITSHIINLYVYYLPEPTLRFTGMYFKLTM